VGLVALTRALGVAVAALALACAAPARGPVDVVHAYFRALGADPMRTLPLLTDAFHRRHGLAVVTAAQARALRDGTSGAPDAASEPASIDRFALAWLAVQSRAELIEIARRLETSVVAATQDGDIASVTVEVVPPRGARFEQRFDLVRAGTSEPWRIDAIGQKGVGGDNAAAAFVAYPSEAGRHRVQRVN
jgi:hypothetical protein